MRVGAPLGFGDHPTFYLMNVVSDYAGQQGSSLAERLVDVRTEAARHGGMRSARSAFGLRAHRYPPFNPWTESI